MQAAAGYGSVVSKTKRLKNRWSRISIKSPLPGPDTERAVIVEEALNALHHGHVEAGWACEPCFHVFLLLFQHTFVFRLIRLPHKHFFIAAFFCNPVDVAAVYLFGSPLESAGQRRKAAISDGYSAQCEVISGCFSKNGAYPILPFVHTPGANESAGQKIFEFHGRGQIAEATIRGGE